MVVALTIAALVAIGPYTSARRVTHTRPLSGLAQAIVDEATRSSPTIDAMIAAIEQTDVIVYVAARFDPASGGGRTRLVGANASARYLELTINLSLSPGRRTEILAHELQHVLEIARATDVRDDVGMKRLFDRIGWCEGPQRYETAAARDIESVVHLEWWSAGAISRRAGSANARSPR